MLNEQCNLAFATLTVFNKSKQRNKINKFKQTSLFFRKLLLFWGGGSLRIIISIQIKAERSVLCSAVNSGYTLLLLLVLLSLF